MGADFLGFCTAFQDLPEAIKWPVSERMTDAQLAAANSRAITVGKGELPSWWQIVEDTGHKPRPVAAHAVCVFAHPYCAWAHGLNENTNGRLRPYFTKGLILKPSAKLKIRQAEK